jgi:hypothetical protein
LWNGWYTLEARHLCSHPVELLPWCIASPMSLDSLVTHYLVKSFLPFSGRNPTLNFLWLCP